MQKNLYFRTVLRRDSIIEAFLVSTFIKIASYPRLLIEVFIRKNFGQRYFRLSLVIVATLVLLFIPYYLNKAFGVHLRYTPEQYRQAGVEPPTSPFSYGHFVTWYIFTALFLFAGIVRYNEIKRNPSVYDFAKYSLYSGGINPIFSNLRLAGKKTDLRQIETLLEPAPFFILGILLMLLHQLLGIVLIFCSIVYSLSYVAAYAAGDNFVLDKIDEIICNEELKRTFVDDLDDGETRGFRFVGRKPHDAEMRKQLLPLMTEDEDIVIAR